MLGATEIVCICHEELAAGSQVTQWQPGTQLPHLLFGLTIFWHLLPHVLNFRLI